MQLWMGFSNSIIGLSTIRTVFAREGLNPRRAINSVECHMTWLSSLNPTSNSYHCSPTTFCSGNPRTNVQCSLYRVCTGFMCGPKICFVTVLPVRSSMVVHTMTWKL